MKYFSILFLLYFLVIPTNLRAVHTIQVQTAQPVNSVNLTVQEFLQKSNQDWEYIQNKKLRWSEKLILKKLRKKLAKDSQKNPSLLQQTITIPINKEAEKDKLNACDLSLIIGLVAIISPFIPFISLISIIAAPAAIVFGLIGISKELPRRKKAFIGLLLGVATLGFLYWAFTSFG